MISQFLVCNYYAYLKDSKLMKLKLEQHPPENRKIFNGMLWTRLESQLELKIVSILRCSAAAHWISLTLGAAA